MIWWDWKTSQRLTLMTAMLAVAAIPLTLVGVFTNDWWALLGGTGFLFIPQIMGWMLFVGLKTGRMPSAYGRSELRAETPTWFWLTGGLYAGLLLLFLWIISGSAIGGNIWGF